MIAEGSSGSRIYVRILTEGTDTADWPLSRKFGCQNEMAYELLVLAQELGLEPLVFPGSRRFYSNVTSVLGFCHWCKVKSIFDRLRDEHNITLKMINMGGGAC